MEESATTTTVDLPIDAQAAWELVTDPEALGCWLAATVDLSLEVGAEGTIRFTQEPGGEHGIDDDPTVVLVEEVVPTERLAFRWASASRPPSTVEILLEPIDLDDCVGTRVVIVERLVPQGLAALGAAMCSSVLSAR
jgi:uncharacterized protein YndB with AHSA1/START domain